MRKARLSGKKICIVAAGGAGLSSLVVLAVFFIATKSPLVWMIGIVLTAVLFLWGVLFLVFFQRMLTRFCTELCSLLDGLVDGGEKPDIDWNSETLLARIGHRLIRLYDIMQQGRSRVEAEKADLQSLVSDISHQTRTPIANLKMIHDTLLIRSMSPERQREYQEAMGSQLDKLDFLIRAMVKTSRLETGVITLERKETPLSETLVAAVNGILGPLEKKRIELHVECP